MSNPDLDRLLSGEAPEETQAGGDGKFEPKFNVREEFALWVREQFPELKKHAKKGKTYEMLEARRDEIYEAALGAINHGVTSTEACASNRLNSGWQAFERGFSEDGNASKRVRGLERYVKALEDLSISLGGNKHFTDAGKFLSGTPYSTYQMGNLDAYVYRAGPGNGSDTRYLVFEVEQSFEGEDSPVLIGELSGLTKWNFETLQMITSKFKGVESAFIEEVDRRVPEEGVYMDSAYRAERVSSVSTDLTRKAGRFGSYSGGTGGYYGGETDTLWSSGNLDDGEWAEGWRGKGK